MFLFELAMELGERSADMADAAPSLGFEGLTPTSDLTPEQVAAFRARFAKAPVAPLPPAGAYPGTAPGPQAGPAGWGPPGELPRPAASGGPGGMSKGQLALVAGAVIAVIGLFAFMATNGGRDEAREREIARVASEHDARDDEAIAGGTTAAVDPNAPKDIPRFCKAALDIKQFSNDLVESMDAQDFDRTKQTMIAGVDDWQQNVDVMQETLPASFAEKGQTYERSYRALYEAWMGSANADEARPRVLGMDLKPGSAAWYDLQTLIFDTCL